jgi:hypothetical protein
MNDLDDSYQFTALFRYSGQNLATLSSTGTYTIEEVINKSMAMWWDEYKNATMEHINKVTAPSNPSATPA